MGSLFAGGLLGLYLSSRFLWVHWNDGGYDSSHEMIILLTFLFCLGGLLVGAAFSFLVGSFCSKEDKITETVRLGGLRHASDLSGSFFLGIGDVNSVRTFTYVAKNDDGSFSLRSMPVYETTKFFETEREDGELRTVDREVKGKLLGFLFTGGSRRHEFHVPIGSVVMGFKV